MAYELKDGQGSLFKNDKQGVEKRPDYTGTLMLTGKAWKLSAWIKQGKSGKYMSLSAQPKEDDAKRTRDAGADETERTPF